MPPKVKVTKEEIIKTAVELVRANGEEALNARAIAASINCSTQPIFSNFSTMDELQKAVITDAYSRYLEFIKNEADSGKYPIYKAYGMAYIRFAKEEQNLFKLLFMRDRSEEETTPTVDFEMSVQMIMKANGINLEKAKLMHLEIWAGVHGIAVMIATSFLQLEWELISDILTDLYQGVRKVHSSEEA